MATDEFTQDNRLIAISTPLGKDVLLLNDLSASESLSSLFVLEAGLLSPLAKSDKVSGDKLIGREAAVRITPASGRPRVFHGVISRFAETGRDLRFVFYQCQIVPWFWLLTLNASCRIFQNQPVPDIIQAIFDDPRYAQFNFRKDFAKLHRADHTRRDYCVQYRETDFNFISRLMEEEGIFYFFKHEGGGNLETSRHVMMLGDTLANLDACPGQPTASFLPVVSAAQEATARVTAWQLVHALRPAKVTLRDYHFELSDVLQEVTKSKPAEVAGADVFEVYDYPGDFAEKFNATSQRLADVHGEGETMAAIRLEEELAPHKSFSGASTCPGFAPGFSFQLTRHSPRMDGTYVLTAVQHAVVQSPPYISGVPTQAAYHNTFTCVAAASSFRPPRLTPKPVVQGVQTAEVWGPRNANGKFIEDIHLDAFGRVRVTFHWDRDAKANTSGVAETDAQSPSCWVRVAQTWAGRGFGAIFTPRCGDEVVVSFLEGDPDQPLIVGSLYNNRHQPPYPLPAEKTRSGFKTRSSLEGKPGNFSEIRFEDKKGHEELVIHAERTMSESVEGSQSVSVGGGQSITVGGNRSITTGGEKDGAKHGDVKELVHNNHNLHVRNDERVGIDGNSSVSVMGGTVVFSKGDYSLSSTKGILITGDTVTIQGIKSLTLIGGGSSVVLDATGVTVLGMPMIQLNPLGAVPPIPPVSALNTWPEDP